MLLSLVPSGLLQPEMQPLGWASVHLRHGNSADLERDFQMTIRTQQELFDVAAKHLLTQNEKSETVTGCLYRKPLADGRVLKCAIGALFPDELYNPDFESRSVVSLLGDTRYKGTDDERSTLPPGDIRDEFAANTEFLCALQGIHDEHEPQYWPLELGRLAWAYQLSTAAFA